MPGIVAPAAMYRDTTGMQTLNQTADQFPRNVLPKLIEVNPDQSRLLTVLHMLGGQTDQQVDHPFKYEWYIQDPIPYDVEASGAVASPATTTIPLVAGHNKRITGGQKLMNTRTGEIVRVPEASGFSGNDVQNVVRAFGTTAAQAINAGDRFLILPSTRSEVGVDPSPVGFNQRSQFNYLEEVSLAAGASFRMLGAKQYAGWQFDREQKKVADHFRAQMDKNLLLGQLKYDTDATTSTIVTATQGLLPSITTNIDSFPTVPSWETFQRIIRPYVLHGDSGRYGSKKRHCFVSPAWMRWASTLPSNMLRMNLPGKLTNNDEENGFSFGWYVSELDVNNVRLFLHVVDWWDDYSDPTSQYDFANLFVVVDKAHVGVRYYKNGGVKLLKGRQPNNVMSELVAWHALYGFQLNNEASCGYFTAPVAG
jgi:hypothetical protein